MCVCVSYNTAALHILQHAVISHRACPLLSSPLCAAIHRSSLGWTRCHFSLQRFSRCFLKLKGVGEQSPARDPFLYLLCFFSPLSLPPFLPPSLFLLPRSNHLAACSARLAVPSCKAMKILQVYTILQSSWSREVWQ